jgi:hypothetical protein
LPFSKASNSMGTRELRHSSETWSIELRAMTGKISSY